MVLCYLHYSTVNTDADLVLTLCAAAPEMPTAARLKEMLCKFGHYWSRSSTKSGPSMRSSSSYSIVQAIGRRGIRLSRR